MKEDRIWKRTKAGAEVGGLAFDGRKRAPLAGKKGRGSHLVGFLYSIKPRNWLGGKRFEKE